MDNNELLDFLKELENQNDEDARFSALFRKVGDIYREEIEKRNNEDYEIDPEG